MDLVVPQFAAFVGNNAWFAVLIVVHVIGAIIGLGPTFAFGVMGPMAGKVPPAGGLALMEAMEKIENGIVNPILLTVQPATGALMIWNRGLNNNFFSADRVWLIAAILIYMAAIYIALVVNGPALKKMISMAKSGQAETPEFGQLAMRTSKMGPLLTLLGVAIIVLMAWKPGGGCGPLVRC